MSDQAKSMQCPSCGANVNVPSRSEKATCEYCGTALTLPKKEKAPVSDKIENLYKLAEAALHGSDYVEAEKYFKQILENDAEDWRAWLGRARIAMVGSEEENGINASKVSSFADRALECAPDDKIDHVKKVLVDEILGSVNWHYKQGLKMATLEGTYYERDQVAEFFVFCQQFVDLVQKGLQYKPEDKDLLKIGITISKRCLEGVGINVLDNAGNIITKNFTANYMGFGQDFRPAYEDFSEKLRKIDPSWQQRQQPEIKKKDCFVATAATGNINHPYCDILRDVRDQILCPNKLGSVFIEKYYRYGPNLAKIIDRSKILKWLAFYLIVKPAALFSWKILKRNDFTFADKKYHFMNDISLGHRLRTTSPSYYTSYISKHQYSRSQKRQK